MASRFDLSKFGIRTIEEAAAYAIGGATSPALEWIVRPIAHELNATHPTEILPVEIAARIAVKHPDRHGAMANEAAKSGLDGSRFQLIKEALDSPPTLGQLFDLRRRGRISREELIQGFRSSEIEPEWHDVLPELLQVLLSPQDAAMARQQGFLTQDEQLSVSAKQGVDAHDANLLFEMSGLPPGAEQMIELWRRGEIDEDRVRQALIEGHIKIKYADDVLKLRYQPLSASVAAEALVRQRIPEAKAVSIAEKNGLARDDFLLWSDMLGRPIGTVQALQLARRGEFTFDQFKDVVARSDVRTEFADDLWKLKRVLPRMTTIHQLVANGSLTKQRATEMVIDLGYDADVAHGIVESAVKGKTQHTRDLAAGQIDSLYESGLEPRTWALEALIGLGYDHDEAEWHLELLEARRLLAALQSHLSVVHRSYVTHKIDEEQAQTELDELQMRDEARDLLLQTWTRERNANVARLSNAQIGQALKHAGMTREEAVQRWQENGYPVDDAKWLADIAMKTPHNAVTPTAT